jgi:uncharacterized protein (TIGR03067 family)
MKPALSIALVLAVSLAAVADAPGDDGADAKVVQGTWRPIAAELAGKPLPAELLKTISLKLDTGKYEVFVGDKPDRGTYTLDATSTPRGMTITGREGPNQGKTFPAIYQIEKKSGEGDTLRICYDLSGAKRPSEFKTLAGTKLYLVTYRRKKDKEE